MVTVRVPATTANLGPGFDTLGLALALYNTLTFEELPEGLYFEGVEPDYATEENLAVVSYKAVLAKLGLKKPARKTAPKTAKKPAAKKSAAKKPAARKTDARKSTARRTAAE